MYLDRLSKLFRTDLRYIFKGSFLMAGSQAVTSIIAFGAAVAFANLIQKDDFGTYQYILSVAELLAVFSLTGLTASAIRSIAKGYEGTLAYAFKASLRWSIGLVLLGVAIGLYYFFQNNLVLALGVIVASLGTPVINSSKLYVSHLNGKRLFLKSSITTIVSYLLPTIAIVAVLLLTKNVLWIICTYFAAHGLVNFGIYLWVKKDAKNIETEHETVSFAKHLSFQNVITNIAAQLDKILLFQFTGAVALAEYMFAISVPRQVQHLFRGARSIVLPKVSAQSFSVLRKTLPRKLLLLYAIVIPILVGYVFLAPYVFEFFFPQYINSIGYSQIYALLFLIMPFNILNDVFIGHAKKRILYKISIFASVYKIIATVVFVPLYGIWGVLLSILSTQSLRALIVGYFFFTEKVED